MIPALPTMRVPEAGGVLSTLAWGVRYPAVGGLGNSVSDALAARSQFYLPALQTLYGGTSAPTYNQNKLLGRGSASGTGIAQEITLGSNLTLSGTTLTATGSSSGGGLDPQSAIYPPFTVGTDDDEFNDGVFSGWTAVNSGSHLPNIVETNNIASFLLPGGAAVAELSAYMKLVTPATNDFIELALHGAGVSQNFNIAGLIFADGTSYGAGSQIAWSIDATENLYFAPRLTGYNTQTSESHYTIEAAAKASDTFLRFKYEGSNHFRGYVSPDGIQWVDITGQLTFTLSPTAIGFFVSTWGGANPFCWALRYFKHSA